MMKYLIATPLLIATAMLFGISNMAVAQENADLIHAFGVFCDTKEQSTSFVKAWNGTNSEAARTEVNKAAGKDTACMQIEAMIVELESYDTITTSTGMWLAIKVSLVAVHSPESWLRITPIEQYTFRKIADAPKQSSI